MTPTDEERLRVLRAAGFDCGWGSDQPHTTDPDGNYPPVDSVHDLTQDDLAAKYLLPIATPHIDSIWPNERGWAIMYRGNDVIIGDEDIIGAPTFGEALHAFVLALLNAGIIPEDPR